MSQPPQPPLPPPPLPPREEEEEEEEEGGGAPPQPRPQGPGYRPGSPHCRRCLMTFPSAAWAARHAKRQHPRDFAAAAAPRGSRFVCFACGRPFASSPALLRHQRRHARPPAPPSPPPGPGPDPHPRPAPPPPPPAPPPAYACAECGRAFAREGALHRHYIRHARGML